MVTERERELRGQIEGPHSATEEKPCSIKRTGWRWRCVSLSDWLNLQEEWEE